MQLWHPLLRWEGVPVRNSFKVKLDIPQGYLLAVSGRLNPASGYYENDSVTSRFGLYFFSTMKMEERESEGVRIAAIFTEKGKDCALFCLSSAVDIIAFYKKWLGIYPHRSLYIIPGGAQPWGGYPFASGIVVIHGQETFDPKKPESEQTWWKRITAHEIGHQYWGEYVMSDDVMEHYTESWLMIGMGICADKEYILGRGGPMSWQRLSRNWTGRERARPPLKFSGGRRRRKSRIPESGSSWGCCSTTGNFMPNLSRPSGSRPRSTGPISTCLSS